VGEADRRIEGNDVCKVSGNRGVEFRRLGGVEYKKIISISFPGLVGRVKVSGDNTAVVISVLPLYNFSVKSLIETSILPVL
jgi:hypothetical protein